MLQAWQQAAEAIILGDEEEKSLVGYILGGMVCKVIQKKRTGGRPA